MMKPSLPAEDETRNNRRILWMVFFGALVWGLMIGVGALLQNIYRGAIVFSVVLVLFGLWALVLLSFQRRPNNK